MPSTLTQPARLPCPADSLWRLLQSILGLTEEHPSLPSDTEGFIRWARANHLQALIHHWAANEPDRSAFADLLREEAAGQWIRNAQLAAWLPTLGKALEGLPWLCLRGPAVGRLLYPDARLRPYLDLDLLLPRDLIEPCAERLADLGFTEPADQFDRSFFLKHHFHLQFCGRAGPLPLLIELHWDVDQPFRASRPDLTGWLERRQPLPEPLQSIPAQAPVDLALALLLHFEKHVGGLTAWVKTGQLDRLLQSGYLTGLIDSALALRQVQQLDQRQEMEAQAQTSRMTPLLAAGLQAVQQVLPGLLEADWILPIDEPLTLKEKQYARPSRRRGSLKHRAMFRSERVTEALLNILDREPGETRTAHLNRTTRSLVHFSGHALGYARHAIKHRLSGCD